MRDSILPAGWLSVYTDGASVGNPGPIGIGGVIIDGTTEVAMFSECPGRGTNNDAEYLAVLGGLVVAARMQARGVRVATDSQLVVNQINGDFVVNAPNLIGHLQSVRAALACFPAGHEIVWVPREQNGIADALASRAVGTPQANLSQPGLPRFWEPCNAPEHSASLLPTSPQVLVLLSA